MGTGRIGRYRLGACLGEGGLGVVHAAFDPQLQRDVAIKLIHPHGTHRNANEWLLREARAIARLNHPNVVQVFDVGMFERDIFIVMQMLAGHTVDVWLERDPPWQDVLAVFLQAARGLDAAHEAGVVHRDLKPANIFVCDDGIVKVLDFGLAKLTLESEADRLRTTLSTIDPCETLPGIDLQTSDAGIVIGTPAYMAPEQHIGVVVDPACDQFAFCAALYRALFGILPFTGGTPRELAKAKFEGRIETPVDRAGVPSWLERVVRRGLAVRPRDRWPSMRHLIAALERRPQQTTTRRIVTAAIVAGVVGFALPSGAAAPATPRADQQVERMAPRLDTLARSWRAAISRPAPSR